MKSSRWSLKASISRKTFQGKRIYEFTLDDSKSSVFGTALEPAEIGFDSSIEKEFYELGFKGWTVRREPALLQAGQYVFIPDFSLEKDGLKIYIEIVGFWTPQYLKHKIQKINQLAKKESIILLVNRNLALCQWRRKTVQLWRDKIDHLIEKLSPSIVTFASQTDRLGGINPWRFRSLSL